MLMLLKLVEGPVLTQLTCKIAELQALRCVADRGEATFADNAVALSIAGADPDDALPCHYAVHHPKRHPGQRFSTAVDRADPAFWAAAAHHFEPPRSWPLLGRLLAPDAGGALRLYLPPRGPRSAPTAAE